MKKLLTSLAILSFLAVKLQAQVSVGLRVGVSPTQSPATSFLIVNRHDPVNQCLFNLQEVSFKPQVGLMARTENDHFWFMGEIVYSQTSVHYSLEYLYRSFLPSSNGDLSSENDVELYTIKRDYVELPISAGVKLGRVEISSGFSVSKDLKVQNEFEEFNGYTASPSGTTLGWHAGLGLNFQLVILELRYHRDFSNYGDNQFINGQELSLHCPVDRFSAMATFRFR